MCILFRPHGLNDNTFKINADFSGLHFLFFVTAGWGTIILLLRRTLVLQQFY